MCLVLHVANAQKKRTATNRTVQLRKTTKSKTKAKINLLPQVDSVAVAAVAVVPPPPAK